MLAIGSETGYEFPALTQALAASANAQTQVAAVTDNANTQAKVEVAAIEEPEEESEDYDIGGMFFNC